MGNKTVALVIGRGSAIISLNGKLVLICDVLHVPALRSPLYSLRAHFKQRGCGFIGDNTMGCMYVYFPTFILHVNDTHDCHLNYVLIGRDGQLSMLDYV